MLRYADHVEVCVELDVTDGYSRTGWEYALTALARLQHATLPDDDDGYLMLNGYLVEWGGNDNPLRTDVTFTIELYDTSVEATTFQTWADAVLHFDREEWRVRSVVCVWMCEHVVTHVIAA
jgi:hypothetical protein